MEGDSEWSLKYNGGSSKELATDRQKSIYDRYNLGDSVTYRGREGIISRKGDFWFRLFLGFTPEGGSEIWVFENDFENFS